MTGIAALIAAQVAAPRSLERSEAASLARAIGGREDLWRPFVRHDPNQRNFMQLYRDPSIDVWLICWDNAQDTGYHDHDRSSGAVYVCTGMLCEDCFHRDEDGWIRERTLEHQAGDGFDFPASYIHGVRHPGGTPAVSVHVYSPALWRMGHYHYDDQGVMNRSSMTYTDELAESG